MSVYLILIIPSLYFILKQLISIVFPFWTIPLPLSLQTRTSFMDLPRLFMNYSNFLPVGGRRVGRARGSRAFDVPQLFYPAE